MTSLLALGEAFARRGMHEAALPVFDRSSQLVARHPERHRDRAAGPDRAERGVSIVTSWARSPPTWRNWPSSIGW